ncbi:MAG: hypothetical protein OXG13_08400 [Gemmatimonadaceae bacterium]|nr:hypothetical protein [Gemmatimonadaceae bacterium]
MAGDEVLASAILDGCCTTALVLQIDGRSFRLRDMEQQLAQADDPSFTAKPPLRVP